MTCVKYFQFSAAVRGFHYYRKSWLPEPEQTLNCFHEAPKQKKKPKCPPKSDKNQKDIRSYFAATPRQVKKKSETKKPKSPNVITIDWILDF